MDPQSTPESQLILQFKGRMQQIGLTPHGPFQETWYQPIGHGKDGGIRVEVGYVYHEIKVRVFLRGEQINTYDLLRQDLGEVVREIDVAKHLVMMGQEQPG